MLFKISGKVWRVFLLRQLTNSLSDLSKRTIPTTRVRFVKADDSNSMCPICQSGRFHPHVSDLSKWTIPTTCVRFVKVDDSIHMCPICQSGRFQQHVSDLSKRTIPTTCVRFVKADDSIHMCPICQSGRFHPHVSDLSKRTIPTTCVRFVKADDFNNMCPICQSGRFHPHVSDLSKWTISTTCVRCNHQVLLFAENAKESNHFLTNEMKQRLAVFHKTWVSYDYMASCFLFKSILNETRVLSIFLRTDDLMVYEV